jgi:hypothetical protein
LFIDPKDIYSFYYISLIPNKEQPIIQEFITHLRQTYLNVFSIVVKDQLLKYKQLQRVDPGFDISIIDGDIYNLSVLMKKTFRSDMVRRNDRWNLLTELLISLNKTTNLPQILFIIDRINNVVHNTGETMLTKLNNGQQLLHVFNSCHNATERFLRAHARPEIREVSVN